MSKQEKQALKKAVKEITGGWRKSTAETYEEAGARLIELGMPVEDVADFLSDLYSAAAGDYGA